MAENTGNPIACNCGGTGRYGVQEAPSEARPFGPNGGTIQCMGSYSTHLCACRLDEPPREGRAAWWTMEAVKTLEHESSTKLNSVSASITIERPVSEDNHRLLRTPENMMYPAFAALEAEFSSVGFMASELREFAIWLSEVADEMDRIETAEIPRAK